MKNISFKIQKILLSSLSIFVLTYFIGHINSLCCGPAYQPDLPDGAERFKKFR